MRQKYYYIYKILNNFFCVYTYKNNIVVLLLWESQKRLSFCYFGQVTWIDFNL